jgi:hypothetical protein
MANPFYRYGVKFDKRDHGMKNSSINGIFYIASRAVQSFKKKRVITISLSVWGGDQSCVEASPNQQKMNNTIIKYHNGETYDE